MGEKVVEDRRVVDNGRILAIVELGVPLHGEDLRGTGPADRLDDAIGLGPGFDDKIAAELAGRLMMD
jgi:hypothetical protein